jgi:hypothetical protein
MFEELQNLIPLHFFARDYGYGCVDDCVNCTIDIAT